MAEEPNGPAEETLIALVRGALPAEEAARIAEEARQRPELAADIALFRGIAQALAETAREPAPGELGWARLSRAIDKESPAPPKARRPLWQLAAAAAAAVLLWQVAAVPFLADRPDETGYAPVSDAPAGRGVTIAFAPTATEAAIRALLQEIDARVSDGPSAIGLWVLTFETEAARNAGLDRLRGADIVESAQAR